MPRNALPLSSNTSEGSPPLLPPRAADCTAVKVRPESVEYAMYPPPAVPTTWFGLRRFTAIAGSLPVRPGGVIVTMCAPGARGSGDWAYAVPEAVQTRPIITANFRVIEAPCGFG